MLIDGLSLRFHGLFLFLSGEVPPITKRRSDDDARVSRDAYDTKIDRFWVESAQKKPTGESGVKNHEMLRFLFSDPEISAPQSPRSRYPTVDVYRSFSTESRSF